MHFMIPNLSLVLSNLFGRLICYQIIYSVAKEGKKARQDAAVFVTQISTAQPKSETIIGLDSP